MSMGAARGDHFGGAPDRFLEIWIPAWPIFGAPPPTHIYDFAFFERDPFMGALHGVRHIRYYDPSLLWLGA